MSFILIDQKFEKQFFDELFDYYLIYSSSYQNFSLVLLFFHGILQSANNSFFSENWKDPTFRMVI